MSQLSNKLNDVIELATTVKFLNHAVFMAAGDSGVSQSSTDALQSICCVINERLMEIDRRLDEVMEALR